MPSLRIYLKDEFCWIYTLLEKEIRIGQSHENHIVLCRPGVSLQHALLCRDGKNFIIQDKSGRGLDINSKTVTKASLSHGDILSISLYRLIFELNEHQKEFPETSIGERTIALPDARLKTCEDVPSCQIHVVSGPDQGKVFPLMKGITQVGRGNQNGIILSDPSVSNVHMELETGLSAIHVRDVGSTNGTKINKQIIQRAEVEIGSEIHLGQTTLKIYPKDPTVPMAIPGLGRLIGQSAKIQEVFQLIEKAAKKEVDVLLQAETGCGKELVAQEIHDKSSRARGPFITLDCSTLPKDLIESELFGHEKGSFTSSIAQRKGAFETAHGGTIFLDEIGELPLEMQSKLLRVIESRKFRRVGGNKDIDSDFRIIAATNRNLDREVRNRRFRLDLYHRLGVFPISIPPLRERKEDIPLLVEHFLKGQSRQVASEAMEKLRAHTWPGNVRELRNVIERALIMMEGHCLSVNNITFLPSSEQDGPPISWEDQKTIPATGSLEEIEKQAILQMLETHKNDKKATARALGMALSTLYEKMKRYKSVG